MKYASVYSYNSNYTYIIIYIHEDDEIASIYRYDILSNDKDDVVCYILLDSTWQSCEERTVDTVIMDDLGDPTEGAEVFATTDAFGSEWSLREAELAHTVASQVVSAEGAEGAMDPGGTPDGEDGEAGASE